jgi:hypothetical protein
MSGVSASVHELVSCAAAASRVLMVAGKRRQGD